MTCSISAPEKPSQASATCIKFKPLVDKSRLRKCTFKISSLSESVGKSTKNTSSKRPLRINSGGKAVTSLAVATTKTFDLFSANQVKKVPNKRLEISSLLDTAERPFSISSIHKTQGDICSATSKTERMFSSV